LYSLSSDAASIGLLNADVTRAKTKIETRTRDPGVGLRPSSEPGVIAELKESATIVVERLRSGKMNDVER
jgi:hypothetical protein